MWWGVLSFQGRVAKITPTSSRADWINILPLSPQKPSMIAQFPREMVVGMYDQAESKEHVQLHNPDRVQERRPLERDLLP
jgi:hypothetical protein